MEGDRRKERVKGPWSKQIVMMIVLAHAPGSWSAMSCHQMAKMPVLLWQKKSLAGLSAFLLSTNAHFL